MATNTLLRVQLSSIHFCWFLIALSWLTPIPGQKGISRLGSFNVNPEFITLSGFSSGGTFAQQMHISYSSLFHGIAVFSHTYYRCGPITNVQAVYDDVCTTLGNRRNSELYDPNLALVDIQNYYSAGLIDNPANLASKPLYVFAGTRNYLFTTDMSLRVLQVFEPYIRNSHVIKTRVHDANLTLPTDRPDFPPCSGPPNALLLSNCGFSGAFDALEFLLGPKAVQAPPHSLRVQPLISFDQTEFFYETGRNDMDSTGFLYVPTICKGNKVKCLLHFYFHGCSVGRQFVGADHILNSGFLEVAEANGIIMVFPQILTSPENVIGCWDTYGFTGEYYATKRGGQVSVVRNMLARILGEDKIHHSTNDVQPLIASQGYQSPSSVPFYSSSSLPPQRLSHSASFPQITSKPVDNDCLYSYLDAQTFIQRCATK